MSMSQITVMNHDHGTDQETRPQKEITSAGSSLSASVSEWALMLARVCFPPGLLAQTSFGDYKRA
jgi:hypothetical protein